MNKNLIIIMAGGLGKRMQSNIPKVLHKIKDIPMLIIIVKKCLSLNIEKILIVLGKYKKIIEDCLNNFLTVEQLNKIEYIIQEIPKGTGHAIQCCKDRLRYFDENINVLIISGDTPLFSINSMNKLLDNNNNISIVSTILEEPFGYGRVIEKNGKFEKIIEEKDANVEQKMIKKINGGIYVFKIGHLINHLSKLKNDNKQNEYYLTDMIKIIKDEELCDVKILNIPETSNIELSGINTKAQLEEINNFKDILFLIKV